MDTLNQERNDSQPELYLIAHKVRGEAAFDVAHRIKCPICEPIRQGLDEAERGSIHCIECDEGYWWIIGTSGHRAYPSDYFALKNCYTKDGSERIIDHFEMPTEADPDHYATGPAPGQPSLIERLGIRRATTPQVTRRI